MAKNLTPWFPNAIMSKAARILPADTTALVTLWTPGVEGSKITAIGVASDDTATKDLQLWLTIGGVDFLLGTKTIPVTAGFITGTPAFNFFDGTQIPWVPIDSDGQRHLLLPSTAVLKGKVTAAMTAAKTMYIYMQGVDL